MKAKNIYISMLIATIILITGCSGVNNKNTTNDTNNSSQSAVSKPVDPKEITDLMQQIQNESGVLKINASKDNDTVNADITLKSDADNKNAKALAEKYAKRLKETYRAKKANVNILQNEKSIANVTKE